MNIMAFRPCFSGTFVPLPVSRVFGGTIARRARVALVVCMTLLATEAGADGNPAARSDDQVAAPDTTLRQAPRSSDWRAQQRELVRENVSLGPSVVALSVGSGALLLGTINFVYANGRPPCQGWICFDALTEAQKVFGAAMMAAGGAGVLVGAFFLPYQIQRRKRLYERIDSGEDLQLAFTVAPAPEGGMAVLSGTF